MKERYEYKIDDGSKIIITEIPEISRFSLVYLFFTDRWIDLARIDNYPHEGRVETHIHRLGEARVEFREMNIEESFETIKNIGDRIKERIKNDSYRNR